MGEMSRHFNFDDFDELCREALEEHEQFLRPGAIGSVPVRLTTDLSTELLPEPPEAAVVDLNANVVDLHPPDEVA